MENNTDVYIAYIVRHLPVQALDLSTLLRRQLFIFEEIFQYTFFQQDNLFSLF